MNARRQDSNSHLLPFCPRLALSLCGSHCHLPAMGTLQTLLHLTRGCTEGAKAESVVGSPKLSLPAGTPPDKLTASLGDANETYPAKEKEGREMPRAGALLGLSPSHGPRGKSAFLPRAEEKVCHGSQEELLPAHSPSITPGACP